MITTEKKIVAAVIAHYMESGTPISLGETAKRVGDISAKDVARATFGCPDLVWTEIERNEGSVHRTVAALEPDEAVLSRVLENAFRVR